MRSVRDDFQLTKDSEGHRFSRKTDRLWTQVQLRFTTYRWFPVRISDISTIQSIRIKPISHFSHCNNV
jgi:hypothetical protein